MAGLMSTGGTLNRVTVYDGNPNNWIVYIDIKSVLPNNYSRLAIRNFGITYSRLRFPENIPVDNTRGPAIDDYDPDTGVLTVSTSGRNMAFSNLIVNVWYV